MSQPIPTLLSKPTSKDCFHKFIFGIDKMVTFGIVPCVWSDAHHELDDPKLRLPGASALFRHGAGFGGGEEWSGNEVLRGTHGMHSIF